MRAHDPNEYNTTPLAHISQFFAIGIVLIAGAVAMPLRAFGVGSLPTLVHGSYNEFGFQQASAVNWRQQLEEFMRRLHDFLRCNPPPPPLPDDWLTSFNACWRATGIPDGSSTSQLQAARSDLAGLEALLLSNSAELDSTTLLATLGTIAEMQFAIQQILDLDEPDPAPPVGDHHD